MYKIHINDRSCSSWDTFDMNTLEKINDLTYFNPIEGKLFSNDVFSIEMDNSINIVHSSVRTGPPIPGVLILDGNKTYGREKKLANAGQTLTASKLRHSAGKLLYKCIPDDIRLPTFLVPYEIKNIGFSKVFKNLYVTIRFENWEDK